MNEFVQLYLVVTAGCFVSRTEGSHLQSEERDLQD